VKKAVDMTSPALRFRAVNHRYATESVGANVEAAVGVTEQFCVGRVFVMRA
jgi:hypothetical protein